MHVWGPDGAQSKGPNSANSLFLFGEKKNNNTNNNNNEIKRQLIKQGTNGQAVQ